MTSTRGCGAEVTAMCWSGASVGVARYLCAECRIEVFEAPVRIVAGEAVRRCSAAHNFSSLSSGVASSIHRSSGVGGVGAEGEVRILVYEDIPPSLLWLVRYLEVYQPLVLLPHAGSEALSDLVSLLAARTQLSVIRLSANSAFDAAAALPRLAAMYPAQEAELASRFRVENTAMMRAMAALLQFAAAGQSNVADVVERGVLRAMYLEDVCAEALQITRMERHPSSAQGRGRAKEGLSLRSLLSVTQSTLGKAMLRQWMALPCCDRAEIDARQSVVAFFAHVEHYAIASQLRVALHHVHSTSHIFTVMRSGRALRKHYVSLYRTICGIVQVQRLLSTVAHEVDRLYVLLQSIVVEPLVKMASALVRTVVGVSVAPRTSLSHGGAGPLPTAAPLRAEAYGGTSVYICDGVDAVLDELRLRLHELRLSLQSKAEAAFEQLPWELRLRLSLRCVYAAPHGYLLCVPAAELMAVVLEYVPEAPKEMEGSAERDDDDRLPCDREETTDAESCSATDDHIPPRGVTLSHHLGAATTPTARERVCRFMLDAFQWQFHHEAQTGEFCFKSAAMEELDTWVGDLQRRVQQREQQVKRELDTSLLYSSLHLLRPTRALGELDCLLSFARISAQEGWCKPEMLAPGGQTPSEEQAEDAAGAAIGLADEMGASEDADDGVLEIENGWHPLLSCQLGMQQLVPFSLHLRTSTDRVCVVLGVSGSGKSVMMNAVAHIVLLAHIGCHVPAVAARMSLINGIFAPSSVAVTFAVPRLLSTSSRRGLAGYRYENHSLAGTGSVDAAAATAQEAEAAQSSFYGECVALHRVLHHVAGEQRAAAGRRPSTLKTLRTVYCDAGRALVLLDEFGRGTAPEDGCALLKGTLRYFAMGGGEEERCAVGAGMEVTAPPRSRWRKAPLVLCATHLIEMLDLPSDAAAAESLGQAAQDVAVVTASGGTGQGDRNGLERTAAQTNVAQNDTHSPMPPLPPPPSFARPTSAVCDPPLPMEWVKVYEMETLITYAQEDSAQSTNADGRNATDKVHAVEATSAASAVGGSRRQPVDVTPTYHLACITPHSGRRRWEDWRRHAESLLDAGPALGRQCGLDAELLTSWESALRILHSTP
jgi:hypothetical protein